MSRKKIFAAVFVAALLCAALASWVLISIFKVEHPGERAQVSVTASVAPEQLYTIPQEQTYTKAKCSFRARYSHGHMTGDRRLNVKLVHSTHRHWIYELAATPGYQVSEIHLRPPPKKSFKRLIPLDSQRLRVRLTRSLKIIGLCGEADPNLTPAVGTAQ